MKAKKNLGQNFLIDQIIINKISENVNANEIGLYRNNDIGFGEDSRVVRGYYYCPDFIIKIDDSETKTVKYLLADAKLSALDTVKQYYLKDIVFKYLFSISPISENEEVCGVCLFYGKRGGDEKLQSLYNKQLKDNKIEPIAEVVPMIENENEDQHFEFLDELINKMR